MRSHWMVSLNALYVISKGPASSSDDPAPFLQCRSIEWSASPRNSQTVVSKNRLERSQISGMAAILVLEKSIAYGLISGSDSHTARPIILREPCRDIIVDSIRRAKVQFAYCAMLPPICPFIDRIRYMDDDWCYTLEWSNSLQIVASSRILAWKQCLEILDHAIVIKSNSMPFIADFSCFSHASCHISRCDCTMMLLLFFGNYRKYWLAHWFMITMCFWSRFFRYSPFDWVCVCVCYPLRILPFFYCTLNDANSEITLCLSVWVSLWGSALLIYFYSSPPVR